MIMIVVNEEVEKEEKNLGEFLSMILLVTD